MGLFKDVDSEGYDTYTAYWTDGHDMLVSQTHNNDKEIAEWVLNHLLSHYWKDKLEMVVEDSDCDTIHSMIAKHYSRKDYEE